MIARAFFLAEERDVWGCASKVFPEETLDVDIELGGVITVALRLQTTVAVSTPQNIDGEVDRIQGDRQEIFVGA
jgi:hypothetical protein